MLYNYHKFEPPYPEALNIRHNPGVAFLYVACVLLLIGKGAYSYLKYNQLSDLIFHLVFAAFFSFIALRKFINQTPLLSISAKGLTFRDRPFRSWEMIDTINIASKRTTPQHRAKFLKVTYTLPYSDGQKEDKIDIRQVNYSVDKIYRAIAYYKTGDVSGQW